MFHTAQQPLHEHHTSLVMTALLQQALPNRAVAGQRTPAWDTDSLAAWDLPLTLQQANLYNAHKGQEQKLLGLCLVTECQGILSSRLLPCCYHGCVCIVAAHWRLSRCLERLKGHLMEAGPSCQAPALPLLPSVLP